MMSVEDNMDKLSKDDLYLVYCTKGIRSSMVVRFLNQSGYDAINIEGGLEDWAKANGELLILDSSIKNE